MKTKNNSQNKGIRIYEPEAQLTHPKTVYGFWVFICYKWVTVIVFWFLLLFGFLPDFLEKPTMLFFFFFPSLPFTKMNFDVVKTMHKWSQEQFSLRLVDAGLSPSRCWQPPGGAAVHHRLRDKYEMMNCQSVATNLVSQLKIVICSVFGREVKRQPSSRSKYEPFPRL